MIRLIFGFLLTMGSIGTMDIDPNANIIVYSLFAVLGLIIMGFGVKKIT